MKEWLQELITVTKKIQDEIPGDTITLEERIDKDTQKANTLLAEGMLESLKSLGADTKVVEEKLEAPTIDWEEVDNEFNRLVEENQKVKELTNELREMTNAVLSKPQVTSVFIQLGLDGMIQIIDLILTKLDEGPKGKEGEVKTQVENAKKAVRDYLQSVVDIFRAIKDSSPIDLDHLENAVIDKLGSSIQIGILDWDAFKKMLLEILKACKALGGNTHILEQKVGQISPDSPVLTISRLEIVLATQVNAKTRDLARRLQAELEAVQTNPDVQKLIVEIFVNGLAVALQTVLENMNE